MAISINNYREPQIKLTNEDRQFINLINNRITMYGQIPYTVPEKLIIELIKECALYFFRMGYWRSQQTVFYRLPREEIVEFLKYQNQCNCNGESCQEYPDCDHQKHIQHHVHPEQINNDYRNLRGYAIKLPAFVNSIRDIWECNKTNDPSVQEIVDSTSDLIFRQQMSPYGYSLIGINSHLYMYEVTAKIQQQAVVKAVLGTTVPFRWNNATHTLILNKEVKKETVSLMIQCDCNVEIEKLYIDDLFIRYVYARTKLELRRLIGSHTIQLPGDVTLNIDEICYGAQEEVEKIEEQLKGATGIGDLILQR